MPNITPEQLKEHNQILKSLEEDRTSWHRLWRELSDLYLPQRYRWLMTAKELSSTRARRQAIINNTGTQAARTLAAGMLNGVTSPARPWLKLRVPGIDTSQDDARDLAIWLEQTEAALLRIMASSNFYMSMAVLFLDMVVFGTAANLIYEDNETVFRCYNPPLGEFFFAQSDRQQVNVFARKFMMKVYQYVQRWPDRSVWSDRVKTAVQAGGAQLNMDVEVSHIIGPNLKGIVPSKFSYFEMYWETRRQVEAAIVLEKHGFNELPGIFARWEISGQDAYGVSPGMDALGDNYELQHLHRNKGEILEKVHKPAMLADVQLQSNPVALMPNGVTWVPNLANTSGARPIMQIANPAFDQIQLDKQSIEQRIKDTFFNFLFTGITDLQTVRSAVEIEARDSEKLILLGAVLERFESEGLDPGVRRIYNISKRAGLLPPPPPQYKGLTLDVQYVSVLSIAQRAVGTAPTERFLALVGNLAALVPAALDVPDFDRLLINYARDVGVRESEIRSLTQVAAERAQKNATSAAAAAIDGGGQIAKSAKVLSDTPVGGGGSALDSILNNGGSYRPLG